MKRQDQEQDGLWKQAWEQPDEMDAPAKQYILHSIHERMEQVRHKRKQLFYIGLSAAAAILVGLFLKLPGAGTRITEKDWQELASNDTTRKILLGDGTELWLAPHSAVRVYPQFTQQRSTVLTKGTAFFNVARDAQHRFSIAVNQQQVTVLGTAFTIHKLDSVDLQLTVKDGKVALDNAGGQYVLSGGQQICTEGAVTGIVQPAGLSSADWWLEQQVRWRNIELGELLNRVESYYQVKLKYNTIDRTKKITLTWDLTISLADNLSVLNALTGYNIH